MMKKSRKLTQKIAGSTLTAVTFCLLSTTPAYADDPAVVKLLALIEQHTNNILQNVNGIPAYIQAMAAYANNMVASTASEQKPFETAKLQSDFATLYNAQLANNTYQQTTLPQQLTSAFFSYSPSVINSKTLPNANDLTYQTLLGQPYFDPDPRQTKNGTKVDAAYNYIQNASGLTLSHELPGNPSWNGTQQDQLKYTAFYNSMSAVQTYNAYILGQAYAEQHNGNAFTNAQTTLLQDANSPDWFTQVGSENMGIVMRQLLMFESQIYVLLTQMLTTQKQQLQATAMTNTLLILGNQFTEGTLLRNAKKKTITP